jgi:hypothetical protein
MAVRAIYKFITAAGDLQPDQDTDIADLKARLQEPGTKVLLYLHGGLVNREDGLDCATRLSGQGKTSLDADDSWIQIYIVWQTGAFEEIERNWTSFVKTDRLYQAIVSKLMMFLAQRLSLPSEDGRSLIETVPMSEDEIRERLKGEPEKEEKPFAELEARLRTSENADGRTSLAEEKTTAQLEKEFGAYLGKDREFRDATNDLDAAVNRNLDGRGGGGGSAEAGELLLSHLSNTTKDKMAAAAKAEASEPGEGDENARGVLTIAGFVLKAAVSVAGRCIKRFRNKRDHGLHATVTEEVCREFYGDVVGAAIWGEMVEDAKRHFKPGGFGLDLVQWISDAKPSRFVVIGHSAGSIWASRLLLGMAALNLPLKLDLCLLAPAVRADLFAETLGKAGSFIGRCQMFTMDGALERADAVLGHDKGYIYPSSLLYLVSGIFEREDDEAYCDAPILGMQRFGTENWLSETERTNGETIAAFFKEPDKAIYLSKESGKTAATSHGGFDDDEERALGFPRAVTTIAIVVGINIYPKKASQRELKGAVADACDFATWALDQNGGDVAPADLYFWTHPWPTQQNIQDLNDRGINTDDLEALLEAPPQFESSEGPIPPDHRRPPRAEEIIETALARASQIPNPQATGPHRVYVFFAGHGVRTHEKNSTTAQTFMVAGDFRNVNLQTAYGLVACDSFRRELLSTGFTEVFMFLDCCRVQDPVLPIPAAVLCGSAEENGELPWSMAHAAQPNKRAFETKDEPLRGAFSLALVDGLRNHRDPSSQGLRARRLDRYVDGTIVTRSRGQRPALECNPDKDDGPVIIAELAPGLPSITLDFSNVPAGTMFTLLDGSLNPVPGFANFAANAGEIVVPNCPAGNYKLARAAPGSAGKLFEHPGDGIIHVE